MRAMWSGLRSARGSRARTAACVGLAVLLTACGGGKDEDGGPRSATWLEGFSYEWDFFNHRISFLDVFVDGPSASISVVGGTSTTGIAPEYPEGCEREGCEEFPFFDTALVSASWGEVTTELVRFRSQLPRQSYWRFA